MFLFLNVLGTVLMMRASRLQRSLRTTAIWSCTEAGVATENVPALEAKGATKQNNFYVCFVWTDAEETADVHACALHTEKTTCEIQAMSLALKHVVKARFSKIWVLFTWSSLQCKRIEANHYTDVWGWWQHDMCGFHSVQITMKSYGFPSIH